MRLRQPGWLLLPLRAFLAMTFCYAGLQKLANPDYLDPNNRGSVVGQMQSLRHTSPIGPLVGLSLHAPTLVGILIALGELAAGVGLLLGLWTRLAAVGGMLLSLSFYLTVSWTTTPYYYGSDIVFLFAWSVFAAFGAAGVLSLDGWLHSRARRLAGLPAAAPAGETESADLRRRRLVLGAATAGGVAVATSAVAGLVAVAGRLAGGTTAKRGPVALGGPSAPPASPTATAGATEKPSGTAIGPASAVPVGEGAQFTDPATGGPAWVIHSRAGTFAAFSASCTHAGCTVNFDAASMQFACPCHGGTFDATTGAVLGGPPPTPLPKIAVQVVNGQIRAQ